ncbi:hypothetical protein SBRCBS47491_002655 [Sporothrix bragantina]|uniref:Uncharacterized protein n=1 Tax=Sporothrix bragantina TaxID=671064 RepID=A0ABP0B8X0_9PEZI
MDIARNLVYGLVQRGHGAVIRVLGRDRTAQIRRWFTTTYRDQPLIFGLVVTWLAFCAVPLAVFVGYATAWAVVAFSVFWAIFLFWSGLGLLFLVPALFIATGLSLAVFAWAAAMYFVGVRVLAAAGYEGPFLFSSSNSSEDKATTTSSTSNNDGSNGVYSGTNGYNFNKNNNNNNTTKPSDKPPSYALLPASVAKSLDLKPRADFGTPPLTSPGEVPISTK